jgi:hypothetical protein
MVIHDIYCDESGKHSDHPVVTFSGVCVAQPKLQQFDDALKELLRRYELRSLHMAAILRASVRRAISGFIPLASKAA